jgi:4,5:9,10-diseco-3-hydroxy-5,9,17-trioxoandrosta-1(10),2-diene-4-oate hydrolase
MSLEEQSSRTAQVGDLSLHYHDIGQGDQTVIMLHGGGPGAAGWSNYSRNAEAFASRFRTIIIDLPGFGKSSKVAATESVFEFLSTAVLGLMDTLKIDRASLVGNSLGGGTALRLCLRAPERVDRLVLMGTAGSVPLFSPLSEGARALFNYYRGDGPTMEKLKKVVDCLVADPSTVSEDLLQKRFDLSRDPAVMASPPLKMLGRHPDDELWRAPLGSLKQQVLLVWGREDRTVPVDAAFILMRAFRHVQLHVFSGCGHWAQWEKADEFNSLVTDFLGRKQ